MADKEIRKNNDGSVYTWTVRCKESGVSVVVDDQTYDPEKYEDMPAEIAP